MNCERPDNQRGSTLIESLVAVGLFGLAAAAIGTLLVGQIRMEGSNTARTTAIGLAERELEDLRSLDYNAIASRSSTQTVDGMQYTLATTVTPDVPVANVKTISTSISWTEPIGAQTYTLNAIYTAVKR